MGESWVRRAAGIGLVASTALALTSVSATAAPEGEIRGLGASNVVKDNYIVVLKDFSTASVENLSAKYGAKVKHTYKSALRGFSAQMSEAQAKSLAGDPSVSYVEADAEVRASDTQTPTPSWGLDRIDQRALPLDNSYTYPNKGAGVTAYIIDTGIRITHSDFGGRAVHGRDTVDNDDDATDCNGHGTHVAGTVGGTKYGVAKDVKLVAVRVLNCAGSGTFAGVIAGIDWVTADVQATPSRKPAVANMSLGGGANQTVDDAVKRSIAAGVTYGLAPATTTAATPATPHRPAPPKPSPSARPNAPTSAPASRTSAPASTSSRPAPPSPRPGSPTTTPRTPSAAPRWPPRTWSAPPPCSSARPRTPPRRKSATAWSPTPPTASSPTPAPAPRTSSCHITGTAPGNPPGQCPAVTNDTDTAIPDASLAASAIVIADCQGKASATGSVKVAIKHTYRGDLELSLIAPSGAVKLLKVSSGGDSADDINATYPVNVSGEDANGKWQLRVRDLYREDTGHIDSWTLDI